MAKPQDSHVTYENFRVRANYLWGKISSCRYIFCGMESSRDSASRTPETPKPDSMPHTSIPNVTTEGESNGEVESQKSNHNYVLIAPEHFSIIQHIYETSQRQEIHIGQIAQMTPILHNINSNLSRLVDVTIQQERELIQTIVTSKSHVPYWLVLLVLLLVSVFAGAVLVEKTGTTIKFSWPTGFEISHTEAAKP